MAGYIAELQDAYLKDHLIPVVGSGISVPLELPDWRTLLEAAAVQFALSDDKCRQITEYLGKYAYLDATDVILKAGVTEEQLQQFVASFLQKAKEESRKKPCPDNNYSDLAQMLSARFLTTNYDQYINDFTGGTSFLLSQLDEISVNEFSRDRYRHAVIPMHGELTEPKSIVLSRNSYDRVYKSADFERQFQYLRGGYTFLFIGFSFDDVYFQELFRKILKKRFSSTHYILFDIKIETEQPDKIRALWEDFGVHALFYDGEKLGHVEAIRKILEQIVYYCDTDVDLSKMEHLPQNGENPLEDDEIKKLLQQGEKLRCEELPSEAYLIYHSVFEREDFKKLEPEIQINVICNLIWCYGVLQNFSKAQEYIEYVKADKTLREKLGKCAVLYAELLWNERQWTQALQVLEDDAQTGFILNELLHDIIENYQMFLPDADTQPGVIKVYEKTEQSSEKKEQLDCAYQRLKEKYINTDTYNLKNLKQYKHADNQQIAYYWLGIIAGQLFHAHADAIAYLLRANELQYTRIQCEELGCNYLALAEDKMRYRKNCKVYDIDKFSLEKAKLAFQYAMQTPDEKLRHSLYQRCGAGFLRVLFLMHYDYEFEMFWDAAKADIEMEEDILLLKAECDARFMYQVSEELLNKLSKDHRLYIELVQDISLAGFFADRKMLENSKQLYRKIKDTLEVEIEGKTRIETYIQSGEMRFLDFCLDSALFTGDLATYQKYMKLSEKYRGKDMLLYAFEQELMQQNEAAENILNQCYEMHPDVSSFQVQNGFYLRHGQREKSLALFEKNLAESKDGLYDRISFFTVYIHQQFQHWQDIGKAIVLYRRFYNEFLADPSRQVELEEMLKPFLADYANADERCEWNRKMLKTSPRIVHKQFYEQMMALYLSNFRLNEAEQILKEAVADMGIENFPKENLMMQHWVDVLRRKQKKTFYTHERPRFSLAYLKGDIKRVATDALYRTENFGCLGQKVLLPIRILLLMQYHGRQKELEGFERIYLVYAGSIQLQKSLCAVEDPFLRQMLQWMEHAENVTLCAPSFKGMCEAYPENKHFKLEQMQMDVYAAEHKEVIKLFREFGQ